MHLVFGHDAFLNIAHNANWRYIKERKQRLIKINNQRENRKQIPYKYNIGDRVIIKGDYSAKYTVTTVNNNETICVDTGIITDVIKISMSIPILQMNPKEQNFHHGGVRNIQCILQLNLYKIWIKLLQQK